MSHSTESVAARIESDSKTKLVRAADERDLTTSAYLKSVLEEHIDRNPHNLRALDSSTPRNSDETTTTTREESPDGFVEEMLEELE